MKIISWKKFIETDEYISIPSAITVGVFDGVHIGHQRLIQCITAREGLHPVVITFQDNPSRYFHPGKFLGNISTLRQKLSYFESHCADTAVLIDFSLDFSKLSGRAFLDLITEHLELRYLTVGQNFHCGKDNDTNAEDIKTILEEQEVTVDIIQPVCYQREPVSSTRIRKELLSGSVEDVHKMLGKPYGIDLSGIEKKIPEDGTIRVPITDICQIIPPSGCYSGIIRTDERKIPAQITVFSQYIEIPHAGDDIREILITEKMTKEKNDVSRKSNETGNHIQIRQE